MNIANPKMVGDLNKYTILSFIKNNGPISRADCSRELKLSGPAVSKNVNSLLSANLIREIGTNETSMGRKPVLLEFNKNFQYVIGIDIGGKKIRGVLANLAGEIIDKAEILSFSEKSANDVLNQVITLISNVIKENNIEKAKVAAIGIGSPGINDLKTGKNILATFIESWDQINLKSRIEEEFGIKTIVENDVDMDILGETWKGAGKEYKNILYVKLGDGLAARVMLNGQLYRGANLAAGEIGYMILDKNRLRNRFLSRGLLEERICNNTAQKQYMEKCLSKNKEFQFNDQIITIEELIEKADNGDMMAKEVINEIISLLSISLVNSIALLDVELIILGGEIGKVNNEYIEQIKSFMQKHIPFVPEVVTSSLNRYSGAIGGMKVSLEKAEADMVNLW